MIAIIDYGLGNPGSILNMLHKLHFDAIITSDAYEIKGASHLIIPGVGSFDKGISNWNSLGLKDLVDYEVLHKHKPVLGICLGMQMMCIESEEGILSGLGWINAKVKKFIFIEKSFKIPHFGWEEITVLVNSPLFKGLENEARFYFVHSYHVYLNSAGIETAKCTYGYPFTAAFQKDNIFGVQFHPEKSHSFGMRLLSNFISLSK